MKIYVTGEIPDATTEGLLERGAELHTPEREPAGRDEIAGILEWVCRHADGVYMAPGWRQSTLARAIRMAALAAGVSVLGFE